MHVFKNNSLVSPKRHIGEVEKSGIMVVVLLKTRRGASRMGSDVIFSIRLAYPSGRQERAAVCPDLEGRRSIPTEWS
jgi:hypothetical protein